jgi:hypothetical protein
MFWPSFMIGSSLIKSEPRPVGSVIRWLLIPTGRGANSAGQVVYFFKY